MSTINLNTQDFRSQFPSFNCSPAVSDQTLQGWFATATLYINNQKGWCYLGGMNVAQKTQALYLMTAHLGTLARNIEQNELEGVLTSATIDKVTVALLAPPVQSQWQYWMQSTPYGKQLLALLQIVGVGGMYIGGRPVLGAFRGPAGWR